MARHAVITPAAASPTEAYLAEVAGLLHGPQRRRKEILAELRDGLRDATDSRRGDTTPEQAEQQAIAAFGPAPMVAAAFAGELATAYARRTITAYIATGPLVGIWWLLLLQPHPWRASLIALLAAIPVLPLIAIAIAAAVSTLATTGRLMRWLPETSPAHAVTAVIGLAGLVLAADITVLAVYTSSAIPMQPLAAAAVIASLIRIGCGLHTLRRATSIRRTLTQPNSHGHAHR
jgi:HAAS